MSASPLSPLPTHTPRPSTSSPLPEVPRWGYAPFGETGDRIPVGTLTLPTWPDASATVASPTPVAATLSALPTSPPSSEPAPPALDSVSFEPVPSVAVGASSEPTFAGAPVTAPPAPASPSGPEVASPEPDFTDDDLRSAFTLLFKDIGNTKSDVRLEPMLRATVRRAIAESSPAGRPFRTPSTTDRFLWRMQALFSSRTYEDILFEKTHRFQVEEVFLVDADSLALVSYASVNPGRHASAKRIETTVKRLAHKARNEHGRIVPMFRLPDGRNVFCHQGRFITLLAVVRGMPNEMALTDLGYTLETIENRFHERFHVPGSPLLKVLQPFLEDCLLIQSPASAA